MKPSRTCFESSVPRRVRARGLQGWAATPAACRPGALTGRVPKQVLRVLGSLLAVVSCIFTLTRPVSAADSGKIAVAAKPVKKPPLPTEVFSVAGHKAFLISPTNRVAGAAMPWVWYAPIQGDSDKPGGHLTWMLEQFLAAGIGIAGMNTAQSYGLYGSRQDLVLLSALYEELVQKRGLSRKPCLLAQSRGGMQSYNWAMECPASVAGIAGIYAMFDVTQPASRLAGLAKERVPLFNLHGDSDTVVPLDKYPAELHRRYRQFGGEITLVVIKGEGHKVLPEYFENQALVDFVIAQARAGKAGAPRTP